MKIIDDTRVHWLSGGKVYKRAFNLKINYGFPLKQARPFTFGSPSWDKRLPNRTDKWQ